MIKSLNLCYLERILWGQTANSHAWNTSDLPPETHFSREVQPPTLKFSAATVELPTLLSQISTHTDGVGGGLEPVMKRRVNQKAVSSHVFQKYSPLVCGVLLTVPRPKHSGSSMPGPERAATDRDLWTIFLANSPAQQPLDHLLFHFSW